jgi:hypothetical protein
VPFLRFSKDRRGYESTFLLHAHRAGERDAPALLYWFRTPPHVKMGRAALDEETIGVLEDTHPSVNFDWPRILATRPQPSEPPPDPGRLPRPRSRGESRGDERRGPRPARQAPPVRDVSTPAPSAERLAERPGEPAAEGAVSVPEPVEIPPQEPTFSEVVEPETPGRRFTRIFDAPSTDTRAAEPGQPNESPPEVGRLSEPSASERALGSEQLERLRGRYAAVMARIARRITDAALVDRLRAIAERANPDGWVTDADVKAGVAGLNDVYAELLPYVGRRRRRSRSGRRAPADSGVLLTGELQHADPATASASPDADVDDADGEEEPDDEESPESGE